MYWHKKNANVLVVDSLNYKIHLCANIKINDPISDPMNQWACLTSLQTGQSSDTSRSPLFLCPRCVPADMNPLQRTHGLPEFRTASLPNPCRLFSMVPSPIHCSACNSPTRSHYWNGSGSSLKSKGWIGRPPRSRPVAPRGMESATTAAARSATVNETVQEAPLGHGLFRYPHTECGVRFKPYP